jgi:hypothetical protein
MLTRRCRLPFPATLRSPLELPVIQFDGGRLGSAEAGLEEREESGVAATGLPRILGAGQEEAAQLLLGDGAAAGQALAAEGGQVDGAGVVLRRKVTQPQAFLEDAAKGDQHPVLGRQRVLLPGHRVWIRQGLADPRRLLGAEPRATESGSGVPGPRAGSARRGSRAPAAPAAPVPRPGPSASSWRPAGVPGRGPTRWCRHTCQGGW